MPFEQFRQEPAYAESYGEAKKEEPMRVAFETKEGEKFFAETLTSPEDPRVEKVQQMLAERFGKKEVDPVEVMKQAMTGRMETGEECPRYLVTVIEDEEGKVVAMASGAAVELVGKLHNVSKDQAVLLDAYTVISPKLQKNGVDKHLFETREKAALRDAESRGLKLVGYVVEDGGKDEEMYNRNGASRIYHYGGHWADNIGRKGRDHYREVPYFQPPLDWDRKTGKPAKGVGVVPEHLMVKVFPEGPSGPHEPWVDKETLMEMVRGMFLYNNEREREYFANPKAYQTHLRFLRSMERKFAADLAKVHSHLGADERQKANLLRLNDKALRQEGQNWDGTHYDEHKSEEDLEREKKAGRKRA